MAQTKKYKDSYIVKELSMHPQPEDPYLEFRWKNGSARLNQRILGLLPKTQQKKILDGLQKRRSQ